MKKVLPLLADCGEFACWVITGDWVDGSQRGCYRTHDPAKPDADAVKRGIAANPHRLRFRMKRNGETLYVGQYVGTINRQKLREPLVMVGAPCGQCWEIEYRNGNGQWERV